MTSPLVALLILLNTPWRVSVVSMVICCPLTVMVPALTPVEKEALFSTTPETSVVALSGPEMLPAPWRIAAVAR